MHVCLYVYPPHHMYTYEVSNEMENDVKLYCITTEGTFSLPNNIEMMVSLLNAR